MIKAFRRLFLITIVSVGILFLGFGMFRTLGLTNKYRRIQHELVNSDTATFPLVIGTPDFPALTLVHNDSWLIRNTDNETSSLEEFIKTSKAKALFLSIEEQDTFYLKKLALILEPLNENVVVSSSYPKVLLMARKEQPQWLYVANQIKWTQLKVLTSLYVETVAVIKEDIFVVNTENPETVGVYGRIINELRRRKKTILVKTTNLNSIDATLADLPSWADGALLKKSN